MNKGKIVELLYALDVGNSDGKVASKMLQCLFKGLPYKELVDNFQFVDENKLVPYNKLTAETALYWKELANFLLTEGGGAVDYLEKLVPELTAFCQYVRHYVMEVEKSEDNSSWVFIAKQLIELTSVFDLADEVGRGNLGQLCKDLMAHSKVDTSFIEPLMAIFTVVRSNQDARIQEIVEIIADLRDPDNQVEAERKVIDESMEMDATPAGTPLSKAEIAKKEEEKRKKQVCF